MTNENSPVKQMSTIPSEINWRLRNWPDLCHFFRILPRIITDESWNSFHGEISRISREWEISFRLGGHSLLRLFHPSTGYLSNLLATANPFLSWCPSSPLLLLPSHSSSEIRLESRNRKVVLRRGSKGGYFIGGNRLFHPLPFDFPVTDPSSRLVRVWKIRGRKRTGLGRGAIN